MKNKRRYMQGLLLIILVAMIMVVMTACWPNDIEEETKIVEEETRGVMTKLEQIEYFGQRLTDIAYFYPSERVKKTDLDQVLIYGISQILIDDQDPYIDLLNRILKPIGPEIQFVLGTYEGPSYFQGVTDDTILQHWEHHGFLDDGASGTTLTDRKMRTVSFASDTVQNRNLVLEDKSYNIHFVMPYLLKREAYLSESAGYDEAYQALLEIVDERKGQVIKEDMSQNDLVSLYASDLIMLWHTMENFYPLVERKTDQWHNSLKDSLTLLTNDFDKYDHERQIKVMLAGLQDSHSIIIGDKADRAFLPIRLNRIDEKIYVTYSRVDGLIIGDQIIGIGEDNLEKTFDSNYLEGPGSPQYRLFWSEFKLTQGVKDESVEITFKREDQVMTKLVTYSEAWMVRSYSDYQSYDIIDGVTYLSMEDFDTKTFAQAIFKINKSKGLIIDCRTYPYQDNMEILKYLTDKPIDSLQNVIDINFEAKRVNVKQKVMKTKYSPKKDNTIQVPLVILIDVTSQSRGEYLPATLKDNGLGILVGRSTSGVPSLGGSLELPSGLNIKFSVWGIRHADGNVFGPEGVVADHVVERADLLKKEPFINKALQVIDASRK